MAGRMGADVRVNRRQFLQGCAIAALAVQAGCAAPVGASNSYLTGVVEPGRMNPVFLWTDVALQALRDQLVPPPQAARALAMGHVAGFLAVNGLTQRYDDMDRVGAGPRGADPEVAYGIAAATAFAEHFQQPFLFDRRRFLAAYPDGEGKDLGVAWGRQVGNQIVKLRTNDGAEPSKAGFYLDRYPPRRDVMGWSPTGPLFDSGRAQPPFLTTYHRGLLPGFGRVRTWTVGAPEPYRAPPFPDPRSPEFAEDFALVKSLGGADSTERTAEQEQIAVFWEDGPWGITPPGHFALIAVQLFQHRDWSLDRLARAMALVSMAMADGAIVTWDCKYYFDILRPETAIRYRAGQFGNPDPRVVADPAWQSYIPTPPFPAYTSGHSAFGAAAGEMIALILGRDDIPFSRTAPDTVVWPEHLRGVTRRWPSLTAAVEENGMSRLYGGVHWMADNVEGIRIGRRIAREAHHGMYLERT